MMRHLLIAALVALAGPGFAQTGEIFIPNKTPRVVQDVVEPSNRLAACLARANAANCTGVEIDPQGLALESATGAPDIQFETLTLDLGGGAVTTTEYPPEQEPDYDAPPQGKVILPAIAITIEFDFDRAYIRHDQFGKLDTLAQALQDPALHGTPFMIIGHTDAAGSYAYNCDLSRRRAHEVVNALRHRYVTIPLYPVGFGEHVLKNAYDPRAAENRRVAFLRLPQYPDEVLSTAQRVCGGY